MAASSAAAFWLTSLLLVMVPGADWAFVVGSGLRGHSALPAVAGLVLGYVTVTAAVAAGIGLLVARSPAALTAISVAGGAYLIWHGAGTLARAGTQAPAGPAQAGAARPGPARAVLARGIGVSALNPKGLLLLVALLPQFTSPRWAWPLPVQLGFLGMVFVLTVAAFYLSLGALARKVLRARPGAARAVTRCSGVAMIVIGAVLLIGRFVH